MQWLIYLGALILLLIIGRRRLAGIIHARWTPRGLTDDGWRDL